MLQSDLVSHPSPDLQDGCKMAPKYPRVVFMLTMSTGVRDQSRCLRAGIDVLWAVL